jgi:hypothetical protein
VHEDRFGPVRAAEHELLLAVDDEFVAERRDAAPKIV